MGNHVEKPLLESLPPATPDQITSGESAQENNSSRVTSLPFSELPPDYHCFTLSPHRGLGEHLEECASLHIDVPETATHLLALAINPGR